MIAAPAQRRTLLANGFEPIPIRGKAPTWNGWAADAITEARLTETEAAHPDHTNTGIRTGRCAAIDIDLTDETHAADIEKSIVEHLGETILRRVGSKGALLCYRNELPLRKITIGTKEKRLVEFLGEGQQFAAYGIHPSTGKAYDWPNDFFGGEPAQTPLADLPEVTPQQLRTAAQAVAAKLRELGYGAVTISEAGAAKEAAPPSPASGSPVTAALVENMLLAISPGCDRNKWLIVCAGLVAAPVANPNWDGLDLFIRWSRGDLHGGDVPSNFAGADDCIAQWNRDVEKLNG